MSERISYKVNFDFEQQIYNPDWKHQQQKWNGLNREWEYLYFFCESEPLQNLVNYSAEYIQRLAALGITVTLTQKKETTTSWWGDVSDVPLEQKLNDKGNALACVKDLSLPHYTTMINDLDELRRLASTFKSLCFLRTRYGQAGKNLKLFTDGQALVDYLETTPFLNGPFHQGIIKGEGLLTGPWIKRVVDIGSRLSLLGNGPAKYWYSLVDHFGIYRGGIYLRNHQKFTNCCRALGIDAAGLESTQKKVLQYYQAHYGLKDQIQIDAFLTEEKLIPFQEVNHRRTMGDVLCALTERFGGEGIGMMFFEKRSDVKISDQKNREAFAYDKLTKLGILPLNPNHGDYLFNAFFVSLQRPEHLPAVQNSFAELFHQQPILKTILMHALK